MRVALSRPHPCPCADTSLCAPIVSKFPVAELEVYGFGGGNGSTVDFTRVTTVAWASDPQLMCAAHAAGARVVMAAPQPEKVLTSNDTVRASWVADAVAMVLAKFGDGLVFDWESPCSVGCAEQHWYATLIAETRAAFRKLSPAYQVSVCVAWSPDGIDGRDYDIGAFAAAADLLYVMDYDTRSQIFDACIAGANAPYFGMVHGLSRYLALGVRPSQIILGVPWYGYRYPCVVGTASSAEVCPIAEVPFRGINCSDAAGRELSHDAILAKLPHSSTGRRWDSYQRAPYFNTVEGGRTVQYWYDDEESLKPKYVHARALGLRGVGPFTFTDVSTPSMYEAIDAFLMPRPVPAAARAAASAAAAAGADGASGDKVEQP